MTEASSTISNMNESAAEAALAPAAAAGQSKSSMSIRLVPVENSDQAIVANYSSINLAPSMAFIDFGFLEPAVLASLPRLARSGGKMPEKLNGRLAVRVALGYDSLAGLHQQLGQVLSSLNTARAAAAKKPAK
jgi:hypothetical protein